MTDDRPSTVLFPLFRWGEALRAAKRRRRRLRRCAGALGALAAALGLTVAFPPTPRLVWNASASAPIGLYAVGSREALDPGDMVIARVPAAWRHWAATRRYLPSNVPLVKRVAAVPGDTVCARGNGILVNGQLVAERLPRDHAGRSMPWWYGCVTLRQGAVLLLMPHSASFDGRYFGPTARTDVVGEAHLLWRR